MQPPPASTLPSHVRPTSVGLVPSGTTLPVAAGLFAALIGAIGLTGWLFDVEALKGLGGTVTMKANMAIGLIAHGIALAIMVRGSARSKNGAAAVAGLGAAIGALTLSEHLVGWNLGIDELLFSEAPGARATTSPGRMGPNGATSLLLGGLAIAALKSQSAARRTQVLACTMAVLATIPLAGYAYGAQQLYSIARYTGIAFPTALSLLALSIGILAARRDAGLAAVVSAHGPGGVMARRLLLAAVVLPLSLGYLKVLGQQADLYDTGLGTAFLAISLASVFVVLIWRTASQLNAIDADRERAERERSELLEREHQARLEVEHANRLKDHFLATLSHELRTPLNAILGYARMLRTGVLPVERQARAVEVIERNAVAQTQLVDDLLDMSRMTTGRIRVEKRPLPVSEPLQEAIESVRPAFDAKGITLQLAMDPSAGSVHGDDGRLRQIFWNLLSNALKFTPEGGRIAVALQAGADWIEVTVCDSGAGIDPAFLPYVFEPFRQADAGSARRHGGLGLGLAICRQLAELHGGSIAAASDGPGRGARFTVRLPRCSTPVSAPMHALAGLDVLVVDGDPDSLDLARRLLEEAGASVRTAPAAAPALRQFEERVPDLLVADIGLPGMDGCEMLRVMRTRLPGERTLFPAVAVTGWAQPDDRARTSLAGFSDHVEKPIDPELFVQRLIGAVRGVRSSVPGHTP